MKRAQRAAVEALARIEQQLGLQQVTQEQRGISPPIRALVFVASLAFLVVGALFLAKGPKSPAQSSAAAALLPSTSATRTNSPKQLQ